MSDEIQTFMVTALYGAQSARGLVNIKPPSGDAVTVTPYEARALAWNLISAAEAAEQDAFVVEFIAQGNGGVEMAAAILAEYRHWRDEKRQEARDEGREGA